MVPQPQPELIPRLRVRDLVQTLRFARRRLEEQRELALQADEALAEAKRRHNAAYETKCAIEDLHTSTLRALDAMAVINPDVVMSELVDSDFPSDRWDQRWPKLSNMRSTSS